MTETSAAADTEVQEGNTSSTEPRPHVRSIGGRLGRYVLVDVLGAGGMGVVYSAFDPRLDRGVAVKVLKNDVGTDVDRQRLLREAKAMAKLTHPNVVTVYDAGDENGDVYVAMEFVRGASLRRVLAKQPSARDILAIFQQAGRGLAAAHAAGIIHRDFKPDNVLITEDGVIWKWWWDCPEKVDTLAMPLASPPAWRRSAPRRRSGSSSRSSSGGVGDCRTPRSTP